MRALFIGATILLIIAALLWFLAPDAHINQVTDAIEEALWIIPRNAVSTPGGTSLWIPTN